MYGAKSISANSSKPFRFKKIFCIILTLILCFNIVFLSLNIFLISKNSTSDFNTEKIDSIDKLADAFISFTSKAAPNILHKHKILISSDYPDHLKLNPQAVEITNKLTELMEYLHNLKFYIRGFIHPFK